MKHQQLPHKLWAIIPAAGSGTRFSLTKLKQYQIISHQTVLQHSVDALYQLPLAGCIIPISSQDQIAQSLAFKHPVEFCVGGKERMDSVLCGLQHLEQYVDPNDYILVHDAARPCLHPDQMIKVLEFCKTGNDAAIIAIPVRDTLKKANPQQQIEHTVSREQLWQAQTPQIIKFSVLYHALKYIVKNQLVVTDEASALEHLNIPVTLITGRSDNIKITFPEDLNLAALILKNH